MTICTKSEVARLLKHCFSINHIDIAFIYTALNEIQAALTIKIGIHLFFTPVSSIVFFSFSCCLLPLFPFRLKCERKLKFLPYREWNCSYCFRDFESGSIPSIDLDSSLNSAVIRCEIKVSISIINKTSFYST